MSIIFILLYLFTVINADNKVRVYQRIPENFVATSIYNFVKGNGIMNCFSFEETETQLLLKCLDDNELINAEINIIKPTRLRWTSISYVV
jgi:hypothetical protein|uniref:Uncharacterized protein n=1 Tax=viral metagenome TaxID=1070528 RepID=A0A6C0IUN1_9ZZZZ